MADDHAVLDHERAVPAVQIQFNYAGYDDPAVQSRTCYEVCRKYDKPVIVMEPVKGGNLVNLPDDARRARRAPRRQPRELCHPLRHHEHEADPPRLERELLL